MDLGWAVTAVSQTVPLNYVATPFAVSLAVGSIWHYKLYRAACVWGYL